MMQARERGAIAGRRGAMLVAGAAFLCASFAPAFAQAPAATNAARVVLQPHRIVYEVQLGKKAGSQGLTGANGLMALEILWQCLRRLRHELPAGGGSP